MAKRILTLCLALVIGIAFAMPATAAVKSIKVGGDITIRGIYRQNLDFGNQEYANDEASWLMSTTRIWVNADLTDNVSAVVRLLNERDWSSYGGNQSPRDSNITLDLAYIQMKDLFMPGLGATIGRQEILLGKGFVVGNVNGRWGDSVGNLRASDLTARKSFDAVRVDYEVGTFPLTITAFDAKLSEHAPDNRDIDFYGVNVGYKTDNFKVEGYGLLYDQQTGSHNSLQTFGARIDHNVFPGLNYNIEGAIQTGDLTYWARHMAGWAGNGDVSYTFQSPMQLKLGGAWYYASGDKNGTQSKGAWMPLFPDNLGDRIGRITYAEMVSQTQEAGTNLSVPKVYASFKPSEKSTISLAWFPASTLAAKNTGTGSNEVGYGFNSGITYQYTEDLSLGLCVDYAHIGKAFSPYMSGSKDAWQAIGTVALSF